MKTLRLLFSALLCIVAFASCTTETEDGAWEKMKWQSVSYGKKKVDKSTYYIVPASGGTFVFRCKNYSGFWLCGAHLSKESAAFDMLHIEQDEKDPHTMTHDWFTAKVVKNEMTVEFAPNEGPQRFVTIEVTAGDIFDSFQFVQEAE